MTPLGLDVESAWSELLSGASGVKSRNLDDDSGMAVAPLLDGDLEVTKRELATADRTTLLGASAARQALQVAALPLETTIATSDIDPQRFAIMVGTSFGGIGSLIDEDRRTRFGKGRISPRLVTRAIPSALASHLATTHRITGPTLTYTGACAASAQAIGEAMLAITSGRCDRALAGGSD